MEAPKIPSFIKTRYRFKRFDFHPRYYDEEKEKLKLRKKIIENDLKGSDEVSSKDGIERHARMRMSILPPRLQSIGRWISLIDANEELANGFVVLLVIVGSHANTHPDSLLVVHH